VPYGANDSGQVGTSEEYRARWGTYESAVANRRNKGFDGIGFVFIKIADNLYICGIDIDHKDVNGDFVRSIIAMFPNAYIEKSPSGEGVHIVLLVDVTRVPTENAGSSGGRKLHSRYYCKNPNNGVEAYVSGLTNRYFTFTENTIQDGQDVDQTDEFLKFLDLYMVRKTATEKSAPIIKVSSTPIIKEASALSDEEILSKARSAANATKFIALFDRGDISGYGDDDSAADMALMNMLAFWTRSDRGQMERLFSLSALGQREKWRREDYRRMTVDKDVSDCSAVYEPHRTPTNIWSLPIADADAMTELCMENPKTRKFSIAAARLFLRAFGVKIRSNEMNKCAEIDGLPTKYSGEDAPNILEILISDAANGLAFKRATTQIIHDCFAVIASENRYHPVIELINSEPWDGVDRLPEIYDILGLSDDFHKTLFKITNYRCAV